MIFIPMKYHSIYYDNECPKNHTLVVCENCGRSFYVSNDIIDTLIKVKLNKFESAEYICETCADDLEKNGKLKINKKSTNSSDVKEALDSLIYGFDDLSNSFQDLSTTCLDVSAMIKEALG